MSDFLWLFLWKWRSRLSEGNMSYVYVKQKYLFLVFKVIMENMNLLKIKIHV